MACLITIFTATYNRATTLPRLFDSLVAQEFTDCEWLIVDDGSTDDTEAVVKGFVPKAPFPLRYQRTPNAGKHRAVNLGARLAQGRAFFVVDSDDALAPGALASLAALWPKAEADPRCCGVLGYKASFEGRLLSSPFPKDVEKASSLELKHWRGVKGDKAEVLKLEFQRRHGYPEIPGEAFITEDVVYNRIAREGVFLLAPQVLYHAEYLSGGLTDRSLELRVNNPRGAFLYYRELLEARVPGSVRLRAGANLERLWRHQSQASRLALRAEGALPSLDLGQRLLGRLLFAKDRLQGRPRLGR